MQEHFELRGRRIAYTPLESSDIPGTMQLTPGAPDHLMRSHNFGSLVLGSVCRTCNNGWMSGIEGEAKADLISLIDGDAIPRAPLAVARWALKTAYTLTISTDPPVGRVPQRHMLHLKNRPDLPLGVAVFFRTDKEREWWFSSAMTFGVELGEDTPPEWGKLAMRYYRNSYRYFFRLGSLTLLVLFWPNSVDFVGYNPDLVRPLAGGIDVRPVDDGFTGFAEDHMMHDLAMRSTSCRITADPRAASDLCICGSGLLSPICQMQGHPEDTAGNTGWT